MLLPVDKQSRNMESTGFDLIPSRSRVEVKRLNTSLEIPNDAIAVKKTHIVKLSTSCLKTKLSLFSLDILRLVHGPYSQDPYVVMQSRKEQ